VPVHNRKPAWVRIDDLALKKAKLDGAASPAGAAMTTTFSFSPIIR
jgi:hypothetical protein